MIWSYAAHRHAEEFENFIENVMTKMNAILAEASIIELSITKTTARYKHFNGKPCIYMTPYRHHLEDQ